MILADSCITKQLLHAESCPQWKALTTIILVTKSLVREKQFCTVRLILRQTYNILGNHQNLQDRQLLSKLLNGSRSPIVPCTMYNRTREEKYAVNHGIAIAILVS